MEIENKQGSAAMAEPGGSATERGAVDGPSRAGRAAAPGQAQADDRSTNGTATPRTRLLNARDATEYLGISLSTLNRIEKRGLLVPFRTPGGHRRYAQDMLDEYLENTRKRPGAAGDSTGR